MRDVRSREKTGEQGWQIPVKVFLSSIWLSFTLLMHAASAVRTARIYLC